MHDPPVQMWFPLAAALEAMELFHSFILFGLTVAGVLEDPAFAPTLRDTHGVEMWAGCKRVAKAVGGRGFRALTVELDDDPSDIMNCMDCGARAFSKIRKYQSRRGKEY